MKHRLKAAAFHLVISGCIAGILVLLVTNVWYPEPLFSLAKGRDIFLLLVGCDISLGPLLTLVIFNVRKPRIELIRDVAIIGAVQLCALVYGVSTLLEARPAYIVYNVGIFNVPLANEMIDQQPPGSEASKFPLAPWFGPKLVGAKLPKGADDNNKLLFSALSGQGDVYQFPQYFVPYDEVRQDVREHARSVDQFATELHFDRQSVERAVARYARPGVSIGVLPLRIRKVTALAVVDRSTGDLLGIESVNPT